MQLNEMRMEKRWSSMSWNTNEIDMENKKGDGMIVIIT